MAKIYYGNQRIDGNEINTENIVDEAITNEKLANDAVSTSKVENGSITENKLSAAVQEKLNREVGITDYDDLDNKPVINVKIESEMDLYTGLKDAENGMMIRATTVPAEYITDNTLYEADSHWYLRLIPFYATYDEAEHRFTLIDQCVETYTVPGHDFDTVIGKLASGTIVVNGQTESVALSLSQATDHDTGEILVDGLILTGDYQDHPEDVPEYQVLFNSYVGIRTAELTLNYDVEFDTIIDQNVLDQIVSVTLEQNGYYTIDALNTRDGLGFNEVLDKTKLKTINGTSVVGSGDIKVATFQPFNSSWPTSSSYTTSQFCQAVNDDTNAIVGMAYLGGAKWSDMPSGLSNCDVVVEVLQGPNANTKSIHLIITSGSVAPYTWEYTWWSGSSPKGWVSFKSSIVAGNNVQLSDDSNHRLVISATDTTYAAGSNINITSDIISVDSGDATLGQVLTADGQGGATWGDIHEEIPEFEISLVEFYTLYQGNTITITNSDPRYDIINNNDTVKFKRQETGSEPKWEIIANKELNGKNTIGFTFVDYDSTTDKVINYFIAFIPGVDQYTVQLIQKADEDTTYSAGNGLALTGTEFSIDTTVVATQSDLQGKQDVLTAGANIDITNNVISVTGQLGVTDYDDLDNKPVVNQDLDAVGFMPTANTYYRHIASSDNTNNSGINAFYLTQVINQGDKIHFDTTKSSELQTYLESIVDVNNPMAVMMQASQSDGGQALNIVAAYNNVYAILIVYGNTKILVYDSSNVGFVNLDPNGDYTISVESGTDYYYTVDTIVDPNDEWNGSIIGTTGGGPAPTPSVFADGSIYFYDGTNYHEILDRSMVDIVPTQGSTNLITSGAVYDALAGIEAILATI